MAERIMNTFIEKSSVFPRKQEQVFKIILIGDANVGKTSLTLRFCKGKFPTDPKPTIGIDFYDKQVQIDGETIKLELWNAAGQEMFHNIIVPQFYRNADAAVFVFDVTNVSSFNNLSQWIADLEQHNQLNPNSKIDVIPKVLVGNKCDCTGEIVVSSKMAQKFADSHYMPLFETSALDDNEVNRVNAIFTTLAHQLKNSRPAMTANVPGSDSIILTINYYERKNNGVCNC